MAQTHDDLPAAFETVRDGCWPNSKRHWPKCATGELSHYLGAEGLAERVDHLQTFRL